MINGLDNITDTLFNGSNIGDFNISVVIAQGAWVENTVLQRVSNIEESFRIELISRSIDRLWKTPTSNKMFVLFVETADCDGDNTGPPELKYCGDGGVYYAYNFIEGGEGVGHLGYPWGADKMRDELNIEPKWIAEASAKTYRISQKAGFDPFNFSYIDGTAAFLNNTVGNEDYTSFDDLPGRIPGSWTLPVCDASYWGVNWNWNFVNSTVPKMQLFPCLCGPGGNETAAWAKAAGMANFETLYQTCKLELLNHNRFTWPDGVDQVDFGWREPIKRPGT